MKPVFSLDYLDCFFDQEANVLFHVWKRKPKGDEFRKGLVKVHDEYINLKKTLPVLHWLGDTRLLGVLSIEDQGWLDKVWNEMLFVKAGVRTHAVIIGTDIFSKYAMEKWKKSMQAKYSVQQLLLDTFPSKEDAYKWFKAAEKDLNKKAA
jgi:hypothetical protein